MLGGLFSGLSVSCCRRLPGFFVIASMQDFYPSRSLQTAHGQLVVPLPCVCVHVFAFCLSLTRLFLLLRFVTLATVTGHHRNGTEYEAQADAFPPATIPRTDKCEIYLSTVRTGRQTDTHTHTSHMFHKWSIVYGGLATRTVHERACSVWLQSSCKEKEPQESWGAVVPP